MLTQAWGFYFLIRPVAEYSDFYLWDIFYNFDAILWEDWMFQCVICLEDLKDISYEFFLTLVGIFLKGASKFGLVCIDPILHVRSGSGMGISLFVYVED